MKTIQITVSDDDYARYQAIAAVFLQGAESSDGRGGWIPKGIEEWAQFACRRLGEDMAHHLPPSQKTGGQVIPGPWKPSLCEGRSMKKTAPPARIDVEALRLLDKERVAYHEAGHAVIALSLHLRFVRLQIEPWHTLIPMDEVFWIGQCSYVGARPEHEPMLGFAGLIAEFIHWDDWDEDWWLDLELDSISESDAAGIEKSANWGDDSSQVYGILSDKWESVEKIAAALIRDEVLTDRDIWNLWHS